MVDQVESYFSLIGNNDVPYPILLGTKNVYFMLDHVYVSREKIYPGMTEDEWENVYDDYYESLHSKSKKMMKFRIIQEKNRWLSSN